MLYVAEPFFDTMVKTMRRIVTAVTLYDFETNPSGVWERGKNLLLRDASLKSDFITIFSRQVKQQRKADPSFPHVVNSDMATVFHIVVTKICHARFGAVENVYKEMNDLKSKGHLTFRGELLAGTKRKRSNEEGKDSADTHTLITLPTPDKNGAVNCKFLKGKALLTIGSFPEVNPIRSMAESTVQTFLGTFGAKAAQRFSAKTDYLLAGMGIPNQKIIDAEKRNVRIINLKRLLQLLTGKLPSFDAMHALVPLSKANFTEANYERAVVEAEVQSLEEDEFNNTEADEYLANADSAELVSSPPSVANASNAAKDNHQHPPLITPAPTSHHKEAPAGHS